MKVLGALLTGARVRPGRPRRVEPDRPRVPARARRRGSRLVRDRQPLPAHQGRRGRRPVHAARIRQDEGEPPVRRAASTSARSRRATAAAGTASPRAARWTTSGSIRRSSRFSPRSRREVGALYPAAAPVEEGIASMTVSVKAVDAGEVRRAGGRVRGVRGGRRRGAPRALDGRRRPARSRAQGLLRERRLQGRRRARARPSSRRRRGPGPRDLRRRRAAAAAATEETFRRAAAHATKAAGDLESLAVVLRKHSVRPVRPRRRRWSRAASSRATGSTASRRRPRSRARGSRT